MAHRYNIEIPATFTFRPFQAKWVIGKVDLLDWGTLDAIDMELHTHNADTRGTPPPELIDVTLRLPSFGAIGKVTNDHKSLECLHSLQLSPSSLPTGVLRSWENPDLKTDISGRTFEVLVYSDPSLKKVLSWPQPGVAVEDPWEMREEFLNLPQSLVDLQAFLNRWGLWTRDLGYETGFNDEPKGFLILHPHALWRLQIAFRNALVSGGRRWLSREASIFLKKVPTPPYFTIEESFCMSAIRATVTLDHLREVRFGICKRHDCRRLFERTSKQKRFYCSQACAHLASVREQRKRARTSISSKSRRR